MKIFFLIPLLFVSLSSTAFADKDHFVSVSGDCLKSVTPDRGSVNIVANQLSSDVKTAHREASKKYEELRDAVKKLNLRNLELDTTETSLNEEKEWQNNRSVSKGYRARFGLTVSTSEVARLGEVVSLATKLGIKDFGSLNTYVSPEKYKVEHEACLEEAVKNGRSKAERMAKALGAKLGAVIQIQENAGRGFEPVRPRLQMAKAMVADMAESSAVVEASDQKMNVSVAVSFSLN